MVWSSELSPLYRTVESYNKAAGETQESLSEAEKADCETEKSCTPKNKAPDSDKAPHGSCSHQTGNPGSLLKKLTGDRDSLLIIALIVLLMREKADMKLIAALAFILLT